MKSDNVSVLITLNSFVWGIILAGYGRQQMRHNRCLSFPLDFWKNLKLEKEWTIGLPDINTEFKIIFETLTLLSWMLVERSVRIFLNGLKISLQDNLLSCLLDNWPNSIWTNSDGAHGYWLSWVFLNIYRWMNTFIDCTMYHDRHLQNHYLITIHRCLILSVYLLYRPLLDIGHFFSFLILYTVGRTPWTTDQAVTRPLSAQRTAQTQNKCTQTPMLQVRIELTVPVFGRAKTVHALDRAATVVEQPILCYVISTCRSASLSKLKINQSIRLLEGYTAMHNSFGTVQRSGFLNYLTYNIEGFSSLYVWTYST
jgi:hypothetical protein